MATEPLKITDEMCKYAYDNGFYIALRDFKIPREKWSDFQEAVNAWLKQNR